MYKIVSNSDCILRLTDGAYIPASTDNPAYLDYQAWLEAGNVPEQDPVQPVDPNEAIQAQIDEIERTTMVPRVIREFLLASAELEAKRQADATTAAGKPTTASALLAKNVGYMKTKAVNDQIVQLREQMQ